MFQQIRVDTITEKVLSDALRIRDKSILTTMRIATCPVHHVRRKCTTNATYRLADGSELPKGLCTFVQKDGLIYDDRSCFNPTHCRLTIAG